MAARDMYIVQILHKYSDEKNGGIEEAYKEVCKHLKEVEATKWALEDAMKSKEERELEQKRISPLERMEQITDEMIQKLEDAGYGLKSDDWEKNWEDMLKHAEQWEARRKKQWEEARRKKQWEEEQRKNSENN